MKTIPLSDGYAAIVDDEDYSLVTQYNWYLHKTAHRNYVRGRLKGTPWVEGKSNGLVLMHRLILAPPRGKVTDHRNGNGLDNRRGNLRLATYSQNMQNRHLRRHRYLGVRPASLFKGTFRAQIGINGHTCSLGTFKTAIAAALAYDDAAYERDPDFCALNFPERFIAP